MSSSQQQQQLQPVQRITPSRAELSQEVSYPQHSLLCSLCNLPFRSSSNLRFHMVKTHRCSDPNAALAAIASTASSPASAEPISVKRYHCPEFNCRYSELNGEYFSTFSRVKQHYSWKHLEKKSQCDYCSRRFPSQALLSLHVRDCGRFYNCEECSRFYRDLKNLRSHFKKTGHGLNSIFSQRTRRSPSQLQPQRKQKHQKQMPPTRSIDLDDFAHQPSVSIDVSNSFSSTAAVNSGDAGNSALNLVIVVTGLGGSTPTATVSAVSSMAAAAAASAASSSGKADPASAAAANSRYRPLAPRPLPTANRSSQTDPSPSPELLAALLQQHQQHVQHRQPLVQQQHHHHQPMFSRLHHHAGPIMVPNHASFRGSSCSSFAVVPFQDQQQQQQQQSTMHTQTEYTSPIATDGYSVGVQYSYQPQQQQHQSTTGVTQGVCVGSGASPPVTLGIQAGPDPLEQLLDMETQTNDAFCGGGGFAGCEMETQTYEDFDWDTMFGNVNRRSTGVG